MKIISNKLYEEYTKTVIDYHTEYSKLTKEQLYDIFKFHCQGQRLLNEIVEYIYNLIQKNNNPLKGIFANVNDDMLLRENGLLYSENKKIQNNWNELKKCVGEWILYHSVCEEDYKELNVLEDVESKMQELEGNNDSKRDV